ncbi:MAG TPA: TonB-dependent receptor, partial [Pyrinomonadaceae bacterium]|nr:TonB-dependent receptor [Pyrinomonadaceae bacterium]
MLALLLLAPCATAADARVRQTQRGSVEGVVRDDGGGAVAGARVQLLGPQQAVVKATETDAEGRFRFADVPAGSYVLRVEHSGFAAQRVAADVSHGGGATVNVTLSVEALSEQVTVTAEAGQVADARSIDQQVNVISQKEILDRAPEVVAQVVDEEPGVNLQRTSPSLSAVFVRGLTGRNVAVYVDGVRYTTSAQRGGVGTFFSLVEPSSLETVEILRGPNSSQYGSDVLGGVVNFIPHAPAYGALDDDFHGHTNLFYTSPTNGFGGSTLLTYGARRYGVLLNLNARRINRLRPGGGIDGHSALTRFLGLPSDIVGERLPDTAFTQYGGLLRASVSL